ncbi:MAG: hypothetical protein WKF78_13775 [Candidatus Limnocylindrales bacterium]
MTQIGARASRTRAAARNDKGDEVQRWRFLTFGAVWDLFGMLVSSMLFDAGLKSAQLR